MIRVEISIDGGETWSLTTITKRETPTEYGKYWCWCFWEHEIDVQELWAKKGAEILCRGWDDAMNRQAPAPTSNPNPYTYPYTYPYPHPHPYPYPYP